MWSISAVISLMDSLSLPLASSHVSFGLELVTSSLVQIACTIGILRYVFRNSRMTLDGVFGSIMAYLLIANTFTLIFRFLLHVDPQSFRFPSNEAGHSGGTRQNDLVYFTLVTIATLGYGDILPVTPLARMLAVIPW